MTPNEAKLIELVLSDSATASELSDAKVAVRRERVTSSMMASVKRCLQNVEVRHAQNRSDWEDLVAEYGIDIVETARSILRERDALSR